MRLCEHLRCEQAAVDFLVTAPSGCDGLDGARCREDFQIWELGCANCTVLCRDSSRAAENMLGCGRRGEKHGRVHILYSF